MTDEEDLLAGLSNVTRGKIMLSGVLTETEKVEALKRMTSDSRKRVLTAHASLGVDWDEAVKQAEYDEDEQENNGAEHDRNPNRFVQRWRVDSLRPNKFNETLFKESLSDDSIRKLADTIDYQRVPIEITLKEEIVDGERRWRAAKLLGWEFIDVVVVGDLTDEEVKDRILDAFSSTRDASLAEKAKLFEALKEQLQRRHGRTPGRPEKLIPSGIIYESTEIEEIAAKKAGLPSARTAQRLGAVFQRGTDDMIEQVVSGNLSISRAYAKLTKRAKKSPAKDSSTSSYDDTTGESEISDVSEEEPSIPSKEEVADADSYENGKAPDEEETVHPEADESPQGNEEDEGEDEDEETSDEDPTSDEDLDETKAHDVDDKSNRSEEGVSVDEALEILALHLEELVAEAGLTSAKSEIQSWMKWLFERAKTARDLAA